MDASKANNRGKVNKDDFKDYICVICSTQNQMVNYIPIKEFGFEPENVWNITVEGSLYHDNLLWDKNISKVISGLNFGNRKERTVKIRQESTNDISKVKECIENQFLRSNKDKKILWNVTGGQRTLLLSINDLVKDRPDDAICYLEGNKSKLFISGKNGGFIDYNEEFFGLNIKDALLLGGFVDNSKEIEPEKIDVAKYLDLLRKYETEQKLRDNLLRLNKLKNPTTENDFSDPVIKNIVKENSEKKEKAPFGYILEKMVYAKVKEVAGDRVAELHHSYKLNHDDDLSIDFRTIDELDVVLLTKNGKFIVFECKSGGMEGDVAKSTKYTTYAISGVYGKPILITPLFGKEILKNQHEIKQDEDDNKEAFNALDKEIFGTVRSAVRAAKRANLEVWGIDEIESKLNELLNK